MLCTYSSMAQAVDSTFRADLNTAAKRGDTSQPPLKQTIVKADTIPAKPAVWEPNPKKAGMYSALLPGLGQIYNRQYWKLAIVYGGLATGGYFIATNRDKYQTYRQAYIGRINNPYPTDEYVGIYSSEQLQQLQNDYNKFLNLSVLFTSLGYVMQVVDAITSAHLRNFDISKDISMHVVPVIVPQGVGLGMVMNFR